MIREEGMIEVKAERFKDRKRGEGIRRRIRRRGERERDRLASTLKFRLQILHKLRIRQRERLIFHNKTPPINKKSTKRAKSSKNAKKGKTFKKLNFFNKTKKVGAIQN